MSIFSRRAKAVQASSPAPPVAALTTTQEAQSFSVIVDPAFYGVDTGNSAIQISARISRRAAMQVPAVNKANNLICGALGQLPIELVAPDNTVTPWPLFAQPEQGTTRAKTITDTVGDLLFEGVAWWRVTEFAWNGYPTHVVRLDPRTVSVERNGKVYVTKQGNYGESLEYVPDAELIRFDSPFDALLVVGARAIRTCLSLDTAAQRYADGAPPLDFFTPREGVDPATDEDVAEMLAAWQAARLTRSTPYIPAALDYHVNGWSPEQLQLADARQHAVLEIARLTGVDPEELGVSTTSRTYANSQDRRKHFLDFVVGPYMTAIAERLSLTDVSPRGYTARFNASAFLKNDDLTRQQVYALAIQNGTHTRAEVRAAEGMPPLDPAEVAALPAPAEEVPAND